MYASSVIDVCSQRVLGWQLLKALRTDLVLEALEMGIRTRLHAGRDVAGAFAHPDKGSEHVAVRCTQRLAEAGVVASVGSTADSRDNTLAEAFHSLFKAELVRHRGLWHGIEDLEITAAEDLD